MKKFFVIWLFPVLSFAQQLELERVSRVGSDLTKTPLVEPVIALHPDQADYMAAAAIAVEDPFSDDWHDSWHAVLFISRDNGRSWEQAELPGIYGQMLSGDPWLEWSRDGTLYFSMLAFTPDDRGNKRADVLVYRSHDNGRNWQGPARAFPGLNSVDHPVLSLHSKECCSAVTVFSTSEPFGTISVARSSDTAFAFHKLPSYRPDSLNNNLGSGVAVTDSQMVFSYFSMSKPLPGPLWAVYTYDRGATYRESLITPEHIPVGFPMMAVDRSKGPHHHRINSVWTRSNVQPHIMSAYSDDYGSTWSNPVRVSSDTSIANSVMPNVVVNRNGIVAVTWVDGRNHKGSCWDLYATVSSDGGSTFLPEIRLTPEVSCPDAKHNGGAASRWRWGGDYRGIASDDSGAFYAIWSDTRTGVFQIRMAKFRLRRETNE